MNLADSLQCGHPGCGQVTVLQNHPGAVRDTRLDHFHGDGTLALAQRKGRQLVPCKALKHIQSRRCIFNSTSQWLDCRESFFFFVCRLGTFSCPNLSRAAMGSEPGDRMKMRGAQQWLSPKVLLRLKGGASMKGRPRLSETNCCTIGIIWGGGGHPEKKMKQCNTEHHHRN